MKNKQIIAIGNSDIDTYDNYYGNTFENLDTAYQNISGYFPHSQELQEKVIQQLAVKKLVDNIAQDKLYSEINLDNEISSFLSDYESEKTRETYRISINQFIDYCDGDYFKFLKTNVKDVDNYLIFLKKKYTASRTIRIKITGVSSFFTYLHLRFPVIRVNPFLKQKLPKIIDKHEKDFPSKKDVEILLQDLKRINRNDIICMMKLLYKYGWRIGIFKEMKLTNSGFSSISKGEPVKGKLTKTEIKLKNIKY
jgi:site-specific recombinase XerC